MKVIGVLQGVSAYKEIAEEYMPERHPVRTDLVETVRAAYQFQGIPMFPPNMPQMAILNFSSGRFTHNETTFGITQLVMTPKGDSVATGSTDQSDIVLEHLIELLDRTFGFRLRQSSKKKIYWSHVVVEFDSGVEEYVAKIASAEQIVTRRAAKGRPFKFKNLVFGTSSSQLPPNADTIDILEAQDFIIERRVDQPFEQNRFFSSAPLNTKDHIESLREIEEVFRR